MYNLYKLLDRKVLEIARGQFAYVLLECIDQDSVMDPHRVQYVIHEIEIKGMLVAVVDLVAGTILTIIMGVFDVVRFTTKHWSVGLVAFLCKYSTHSRVTTLRYCVGNIVSTSWASKPSTPT